MQNGTNLITLEANMTIYLRADQNLIWNKEAGKKVADESPLHQYHITFDSNRLDCYRVEKSDGKNGATEIFQYTLNGKSVQLKDTPTALIPRKSSMDSTSQAIAQFGIKVIKESESLTTVTFLPAEYSSLNNPVTIFSETLNSQSPRLPYVEIIPGLSVEHYINTHQLALALRYTNRDNPHFQSYVDQAINFISSFYDNKIARSREMYQQLTVLVLSKDPTIAFEVLKLILAEFKGSSILDLNSLIAIGDAFEAGQMEVDQHSVFTDTHRVEALKILYEKFEAVIKECPGQKENIAFLQAMLKTFTAMADPMKRNGKKLDFAYHQKFIGLFEELAKIKNDETISTLVMATKQALLNIDKDKTDEEIIMFRVLYAVKGILLLCKTMKNQDLLALPEAFTAFHKAAQKQDRLALWHHYYIMLEGFVKLNKWDKFISFLHDKEINEIKVNDKVHLLQHLILVLGQVIVTSRSTDEVLKGNEITAYTQVIASLSLLFLNPKSSYWQYFEAPLQEFIKKHESEFVDLLKELHRSAKSSNATIRDPSYNLLDKLINSSESVIKKDSLTKAGIPEKIEDIKPTEHDVSATVIRTTRIWEASRNKQIGLAAKIRKGIGRYLDNEEMNGALATYIDSNGSKKRDFSNRFVISLHVQEKIQNRISKMKERDVYLILAEGTRGKTVTSMHLTQEIGKKWLPGLPFPVRMPFSFVEDDLTSQTMIEFLKGYPYYMDQSEIQRCQDEKDNFPIVFIGDGHDELRHQRNPYMALGLDKWNVVLSIFTSRPGLMSPEDIHNMFAPINSVTKAPLIERLEGTFLTTFDENDFWECINKYINKVTDRSSEWDLKRYKEEIEKIPNLKKSALEEPFLTFVIAEVLPSIVDKRGDQTGPIPMLELMLEYHKYYITRAAGRIFHSKKEEYQKEVGAQGGISGVRTKLEYTGMNLAARMSAFNTRAVRYVKRPEGERPHPWEKELGNAIYRDGIQLTNSKDGVEFHPPMIHDLNTFLQISKAIENGQHDEDLSIISNLFTMTIEEGTHLLTFFAEKVKSDATFAKVLQSFIDPEFEETLKSFVKKRQAASEAFKARQVADPKLHNDEDPSIMHPAKTGVSKLSYATGVANCKKIFEASKKAGKIELKVEVTEDDPIWV